MAVDWVEVDRRRNEMAAHRKRANAARLKLRLAYLATFIVGALIGRWL